MTGETPDTEPARQRVRRLLLNPLIADGMRSKHGSDADAEKRKLDRICDDLAYMSDDGLRAVRTWMRAHGEGSARCFWPATVSVIGTAESFEPRPIEELPALVRWFASAAGQAAMAGDRLVAEYEFWRRFKRPPVQPKDRERVAQRAVEWASKVVRIEDRMERGLAPLHDDGAWLRWYRETERRAVALLTAGPAA